MGSLSRRAKPQPEKGVKLMTTIPLVTGRHPAGPQIPVAGVCNPTGSTYPLHWGAPVDRMGASSKGDIFCGWFEAYEVAKVDDEPT